MSVSPACPFCGEISDTPLKFCVSCGRAITQEDLNRSGLKMSSKRHPERSGKFSLAKKEYTLHRQFRNLFYTTSIVLALTIGYYCTMRYVLHEHLPFKMDQILEQWMSGNGIAGPHG